MPSGQLEHVYTGRGGIHHMPAVGRIGVKVEIKRRGPVFIGRPVNAMTSVLVHPCFWWSFLLPEQRDGEEDRSGLHQQQSRETAHHEPPENLNEAPAFSGPRPASARPG